MIVETFSDLIRSHYLRRFFVSLSSIFSLRRAIDPPAIRCSLNSNSNEFLVSKETAVGGGVEHENLVLSNEFVKVEFPPSKTWKAEVSRVSPSSFALSKSYFNSV